MEAQTSASFRNEPDLYPRWLVSFFVEERLGLWGAADLRGFDTPVDSSGSGFPYALSFAIPMNPEVMAGVRDGPNESYAAEYAAVNARINEISQRVTREFTGRGFRAAPLAASERTDQVNIKGDFPHKTAATRAGLGWIGRNCQLVTSRFGPWVRLGTVFTSMPLFCGPPVEQDFCGKCSRCVEACPAGALSGEKWRPGVEREVVLDAGACDQWKKEHYFEFHQGHNCGICTAACPFGQKSMRRRRRTGGK